MFENGIISQSKNHLLKYRYILIAILAIIIVLLIIIMSAILKNKNKKDNVVIENNNNTNNSEQEQAMLIELDNKKKEEEQKEKEKKEEESATGVIHLTFDDGPSSDITPQILDILKEKGVKATFFVIHFNDLYGDSDETFIEQEGRKYFLLYLRPIINGTGNYYIEAETREQKRTDVIVDYRGEQYIIEMKIWHGQEYNTRGEKQLAEYLDAYHVNQGYMISFNFNQKKEIGVHEILIDDKKIIEAVV